MRRKLFSALALISTLITFTAVASAVEYGGIGGVPANPDTNNPRTKSIFVYSLKPGEVKPDGIRVANNTDSSKTIEIYATDSEISSGGSFACSQKVDPKNEVGSWIKFEKAELTLESGTNEVVPFSLNLPQIVDVGEHNGCIVIQEKKDASQGGGNGLQLSVRSALRVVVTVPGEIKKELQISDFHAKSTNRRHTFTVSVQNTGNVSLDTNIQVEVRNIFNRLTYTNGGVYPVLPQKQAFELNYEMDHSFWGGIYRTRATAEYDSDPRSQLGQKGNSITKRSSKTKYIIVAPKPLALLIYLLLISVAVTGSVLFLRRKRHYKEIGENWDDYTVKKNDNIHQLASKNNIGWKKIATVNNIKPPYVLEPKSIIKLPPKPKKETKSKKVTKTKADETSS